MEKSFQLEAAVFKIQSFWRSRIFKHKKNLDQQISRQRIKLIYTSITAQNNLIRQKTQNMELLLYLKQFHVEKIDLVNNIETQKSIQKIKQKGYHPPYLFINQYFLGSYDEAQILEDNGFLEDIIEEKYLQRCLICSNDRKSLTDKNCGECGRSFTFFEKQ